MSKVDPYRSRARAVPGMRCLNCLVDLAGSKYRTTPVISKYFCADCTAELNYRAKMYLVGWCNAELPPGILMDDEYIMGMEDRLREGHEILECECKTDFGIRVRPCPIHPLPGA